MTFWEPRIRRSTMKFLLVFLLSLTVHAREFKGIQIPDSQKVGEKTLTLNGVGVRKILIVKDVYAGALYVEDSLKPPVKETDAILNSPTIKKVDLEFLMYVPGSS